MSGTAKSRHSRRSILAGLAVGGAGVGAAAMAFGGGRLAPLVADSESWWVAPPVDLQTANASAWLANVGEIFEFSGPEDGGDYRLVEVTPMQSAGDRPFDVSRQRAFAAVFEASGTSVAQGNRTYTVKNGGQSLELFFAIADPATGTRLVAVFN